jgi:hypothetical protein
MDSRRPKPKAPLVWAWFIAYCIVVALISLVIGGALIVMTVPYLGSKSAQEVGVAQGFAVIGAMICVVGIPYGIAPFLPKRPWVWVYDLVLICLSLTSLYCLPFGIPLLIFWIKPEAKAFFTRT